MPVFKKKSKKNMLDMVPFRVIKTYTEKDGLITLNLPKFKKPFFSKWLVPKNKSEDIHIKLDLLGSLVWKNIDGVKTVQAVCDVVKIEVSDASILQNLEERSAKFITELYKSRFINFTEEKQ
jgi:hypothetical protein